MLFQAFGVSLLSQVWSYNGLKGLSFVLLLSLLLTGKCVEGSRSTRAILLSISPHTTTTCTDKTITEKNATSPIILTGTASKCDSIRAGTYKCTLQVWRVMKGKRLVSDLIKVQRQPNLGPYYKKSYLDVYGLGNSAFCKADVKTHDTRVFFLNRSNGNRVVLAASLLRITLSNLENTQAVIEGEKIEETAKKGYDPCLTVLCGYGASCKARDGSATCVCPPVSCTTSERKLDELLAPVCGSDGITYPNLCRLKAARCAVQRRIRVVSESACEPVVSGNLCEGVSCGFSARCVVQVAVDGSRKPSCVCLTCDDITASPVCGSDRRSYRSGCDMDRAACVGSRNVTVVRRAPCDPCETFNETTGLFQRFCPGTCSFNAAGTPICCESVTCDGNHGGQVCGSDGNTYESECALINHSCKTARDLSIVKQGSCPSRRATTMITGSIGIEANKNCPGNCNSTNPRFTRFVKKFERSVNKNLRDQNGEDIDGKSLVNFQVDEVRQGRAILVFRVYGSTSAQPIRMSDDPGASTRWMYERLYDAKRGALMMTSKENGLTLAASGDPADGFMVEDVCLDVQCEHGAVCRLSRSGSQWLPLCTCEDIGDPRRLNVTLACKLASDGVGAERRFSNSAAVRRETCSTQRKFTFRDECHASSDPCESIGGCLGDSETCVIMNGIASCECVTCGNEYKPVCAGDGQTFRSACEVHRHNCISGGNLIIQKLEACESQCDGVKCWNGAQCEVVPEGTTCVCPSECTDSYVPVCGSDCVTYDNECRMVVTSCENKLDITLTHTGPCDEHCVVGFGEEGSGEMKSECRCRFGATCDDLIDDEDAECICSINCDADDISEVCASNGATYANECEVNKAQCNEQRVIYVVSQGPCKVSCAKTRYGCCKDGKTSAKGPRRGGCPELCKCNTYGSYSTSCDPVSRQCICRPGVGGRQCDRCRPGYWNFRAVAEGLISGCMACRCHVDGSTRDDCDQMTGRCNCKTGVSGIKCTHCLSDRSWVTSAGCDQVGGSMTSSAVSCEDLSCRPGQVCLQEAGFFVCRCPELSSCVDANNEYVCGTDGITYPGVCLMKVMTCKRGVDVRVAAQGSCKDVLSKTTTSPTIPTHSSGTATSPMILTDATAKAQSSMEQEPKPTSESESSGDGCMISDDEDCMGSGEIDEEGLSKSEQRTTTIVTTPANIRATEAVVDFDLTNTPPKATEIYKATGNFRDIGGSTMVYTPELENTQSEVFQEYNSWIQSKMMEYVSQPPLQEKVKAFSITSMGENAWDVSGESVAVTFNLHLVPGVAGEEIASALNLASGGQHNFVIGEPTADMIGSSSIGFKGHATYTEESEWLIPQFGGASYLEFAAVDAYSAITIAIVFRTFDSDGLLFFAAQDEVNQDFISLAVRQGSVEFRFNTGSGQLRLRSTRRVDDHSWHKILARRNRRDGVLMLDNDSGVQGTSPEGTVGLNLDTNVYVGGFDFSVEDRIRNQVNVEKGLTGCIREITIDEIPLVLNSSKGYVTAHRIAQCGPSPCFPNPCKNSASCFITRQAGNFTNKCDCKGNFEGHQCEKEDVVASRDPCASNLCHASATCRSSTGGDGYICDCASGRWGSLCENDAEMTSPSFMPGFAEDSYMERKSLGKNVKSRMEVEVVFYSSQPNGLIFYNGQKRSGKGDFVALTLQESHLVFLFNLGNGITKIRSSKPVILNDWHTVLVSRDMALGTLIVDGGAEESGRSSSKISNLNVRKPLYLGGVPVYNKVLRSVGVTTGLTGAIQKISLDGINLPLTLDANSTYYNVRRFNAHACYHSPCGNRGMCIPRLALFTCVCTEAYSGDHCEEESSEIRKDDVLQDESSLGVYFNGKTKGKYKNYIKTYSRSRSHNSYHMRLRTSSSHGLLLMVGKATQTRNGPGDYLALAISNGKLHLRFNLGSGPAHIISKERIDDGKWATINLERRDKVATLQVNNGLAMQAESPGSTRKLNTDPFVWIGGIDYRPRGIGLYKSFFEPFVGCMSRFFIHDEEVQLRVDALNSPELPSCSSSSKIKRKTRIV